MASRKKRVRWKKDDDDVDDPYADTGAMASGAKAHVENKSRVAELEAEIADLRKDVQQFALAELTSRATCVICHEFTDLPLSICKSSSAHIACLVCALSLTGSAFVVNSFGHPNTWIIKPHFNGGSAAARSASAADRAGGGGGGASAPEGSGGGGGGGGGGSGAPSGASTGLTWSCPVCRHPTGVATMQDFVFGRNFKLLREEEYERLASLLSKAGRSRTLVKCPFCPDLPSSASRTYMIQHAFACACRTFACPIGFDSTSSHRGCGRSCQKSFTLAADDTKHGEDFMNRYSRALRHHAQTECTTLVGFCRQCPPARQQGIPACELSEHADHHVKVDDFWAIVQSIVFDLCSFSTPQPYAGPPVTGALVQQYDKILKALRDVHALLAINWVCKEDHENLKSWLGTVPDTLFQNNTAQIKKLTAEGIWWCRKGVQISVHRTPVPDAPPPVNAPAAAAAAAASSVHVPAAAALPAAAAAPPAAAAAAAAPPAAAAAPPAAAAVPPAAANAPPAAAAAAPVRSQRLIDIDGDHVMRNA